MRFDIGGRLSPVSIRDQMLRARMIVDRALEAGLIDTLGTRNLLIIGAGAAGATAAIRAAQRGVRTLVIDHAPAPFQRQAHCLSRWVDPTQYDWPLSHWSAAAYPWRLPTMPLPWSAGRSNLIAIAWSRAFRMARHSFPRHLAVMFGATTTAAGIAPHIGTSASRLTVTVAVGSTSFTYPAGMLLSCIGFGTEKSTIGRYSGFRFWDSDPFEQSNLGLPTGVTPQVLVSGGGDGALQDVIRIAGGVKSAADLFALIPPDTEMERVLQDAEDQSQRAYVWGGSATHDHASLHQLDAAYRQGVRDYCARAAGAVEAALDAHFAMLARIKPEVTLVHACSHFGKCYGLNRLLVLLLIHYDTQKMAAGKPNLGFRLTVLDGQALSAITAGGGHMRSGGLCANNPALCHGESHGGSAVSARCGSFGTAPLPLPRSDYNVVIVRHGIAPPVLGGTSYSVPIPRQMLPYHSPP